MPETTTTQALDPSRQQQPTRSGAHQGQIAGDGTEAAVSPVQPTPEPDHH